MAAPEYILKNCFPTGFSYGLSGEWVWGKEKIKNNSKIWGGPTGMEEWSVFYAFTNT